MGEMKVDRQKMKLAMARLCLDPKDLPAAAGLPRPTVNNVLAGRSVRPATLGKIAKALNVDPKDLINPES